MSISKHKKRTHVVLSRSLLAVLAELSRQDNRSVSNMIEHQMREWVARQIGFDRYRHLETGPIKPDDTPPEVPVYPSPVRVRPVRMVNGQIYGTRNCNQYTTGEYSAKLAKAQAAKDAVRPANKKP